MKVRVSFTVDIDPEAWATEFSMEADEAKIREDVKVSVESEARGYIERLGLGA